MELNVQYLSDSKGNIKAVQLPIEDWKYLKTKFETFAQELHLKEDLMKSFSQIARMDDKSEKMQTLSDFIDEL